MKTFGIELYLFLFEKEFLMGVGMAVGLIVAMVCLFLGSLIFAVQSWDPESGFDSNYLPDY